MNNIEIIDLIRKHSEDDTTRVQVDKIQRSVDGTIYVMGSIMKRMTSFSRQWMIEGENVTEL